MTAASAMVARPGGRSLAWFVLVVLVAGAGCGLDLPGLTDADAPSSQTYGSATDEGDVGSGDLAADIPADAEPIEVVRVVDGDSLEVERDGKTIEVRLAGYNAPELYVEATDGTDRQTCNGLAARDGVELFVEDVDPVLLIDDGTDRFGRTLGDLVLHGERLVPQLVSLGFGLATGDSATNRELMKKAAETGIGIWSMECGEPVTRVLRIGDVQVDPPGNDRFNLDEEWVELVNSGDTAIELDGWTLRDDTTGHRFPLRGSLAGGATLTVRSGSGRSNESAGGDRTVYLDEKFPVWSNSQETVIVVDPNGVFVDWRFLDEGRG